MNRIGSEDWERLWGGRPPRLPRGVGRWLIALGAVVVLFILATVARGIYTEWLWFESVGFRSVYAKVIATKVVLFLLGGFSFFALLGGNILLARRLAPRWMNIILPVEELAGLRRLIVAGVVVGTAFLSLIFGSVAAGRWSLLLRYLNAQSFGEQDPIFSRDVSYYIFTLPTYRFFQGWLLGALVVTLLAVAAVYFIYFSLRRFDVPVTPAVKGHLSGLGAAILVLFAWGYWMDRFDLVHSTRGVVFGAGYTDIHAQWPALNLLTAIALLAAVLLIINIFRHGFMLPGIAIGLWIGSLVLLGNMYPAYVQRFQVQPNELGKENKYIDYNIALTRQAYGLNKIASQSFPAEVTPSATDIEKNPETINNIRLWDHRPLKDTYNQIQAIRLYYDFVDVDVDRYIIDGQKRQVMLSARELSPEKLSVAAQTWVNRYLQFTHGYGATMSPVNEVTTEAEGQPRLFIKDIPPAGSPSIQRPEIYYGETNTNYVIVNTKTEEFDYPRGDGNVYTRYQGEQGVKLSSFWRKLAYSWQFGDVNILISDQITSQSRLLYNRQIQERVRHIAPFLTLDSDPYLVVDSGRLFWIQDAYTTANKYPYSEPSGGLNYIRNSVKVVIDAYYGTTTFYIADPTDPILQTYASIFPRLFTPIEAMPPSLRAHIR
ncbi:MAG: UPF0182 family protein, partial [Chloroflexi bacterium]|nr:UPF0182 family protein [Chloroflexota bacterium]